MLRRRFEAERPAEVLLARLASLQGPAVPEEQGVGAVREIKQGFGQRES